MLPLISFILGIFACILPHIAIIIYRKYTNAIYSYILLMVGGMAGIISVAMGIYSQQIGLNAQSQGALLWFFENTSTLSIIFVIAISIVYACAISSILKHKRSTEIY